MLVEILEPKGYCAGVSHAIKMAILAKKENPDLEVHVLGMLVHNHFVVRQLEEQGIKTTYDINDIPDGQVIVFTAHGHDQKLDAIAKKKNLRIYDAICPIVKKNNSTIEQEINASHQIIYIGIANHPETVASLSISEDVIFYSVKDGLDFSLIKDKSPLVVNQTTLNVLALKDIYEDIKKHIPEARIADEICFSTRKRQEAIKNMNEDIDFLVVVGDKQSSNTTRLLEVAKMSHPNIPSVMIGSALELDISLLNNKKHIAISSGASVPEEIIDAVYQKIKAIA